MPALALITLISLIMENSGDSDQHVITIIPNWNHMYTDDSVTLKCDIGPNKNINEYDFNWYKDDKQIIHKEHEFTISKVKYKDAGVYECWTGYGFRSHPLTLHVIQKDLKERTTVNFSPNYRKIFVGDKINISCEFGSPAAQSEKYVLYKDNKKIKDGRKSIVLEKAEMSDSGSYTCGKRSPTSYRIRLDVLPGYRHEVILQTPPNILEGDSLDLRCHSYKDKEEAPTFSKDGAIIQKSKHILHLPNVNKSMTGTYQCEKNGNKYEDFLFVQDLLTSPEIKAPSDIKEGDALTLTCNTRRNPLREDAELRFTFYRNGQKVQEFPSSDTYKVQSAERKDSGSYTCEVQTPSGTVRKMSEVSYITIQVPVAGINITTDKEGEDFPLGESLTFTCSVQRGTSFSFYWKHNETTVQQNSERYQLQDNRKVLYIPSLQYHHAGTYQCNAKNQLSVNSTLSEVRHVNILELSQDGRIVQWSVLGILLLVIILAVVLLLIYSQKHSLWRRCHKKPPSPGMNQNEPSGNNDRPTTDNQKTTTGERLYENTRNNPDEEGEVCTYSTVKVVQAPSSYPAAATGQDLTVVYTSVIKNANVTSDTKADPKTRETSDPTDIYQNIHNHQSGH